MGRLCYFHASGMSGDIAAGALVDAGADPSVIVQTLESLYIRLFCRAHKKAIFAYSVGHIRKTAARAISPIRARQTA